LSLRWRDLDALGHLNHATYLTLFGEARDAWLSAVGIGPSDYVIVAVKIDYRAPTNLSDGPLRFDFSVECLGKTSVTTAETVHGIRGDLKAETRVTWVLWDSAASAARAISREERGALKDHVGGPESGPRA